ncbi:6,7-dimethyl-8-ribityllumazine synthase [Dunaliella salina]|uniref:6,7-dimethyl-8-ribityllumazine synthase n=1 Tax=Dunaliella salina TaxID=3046 RepID=A0ABQ7GC91_DUNSA|nr:6,7-dimethyl-8-ribityllumazine synthase [Dunaliella salina]|eukprot:KAF5832218.1 6,7-dimethyl-8-ribityllumazine synthase [Dunaliella salina]
MLSHRQHAVACWAEAPCQAAVPAPRQLTRASRRASSTVSHCSKGQPVHLRRDFQFRSSLSNQPKLAAPGGREVSLAASTYMGDITARPSMKFGVVVARFNSLVTKQLLEGALEDFERHGVDPENVDIQGSTTHYDAVVGAATNGILNAGLQTGVPVIFGVLTTDSLEQALDRAGGKVGNKGGEAALTAIEMATLMRELELSGKATKTKQ